MVSVEQETESSQDEALPTLPEILESPDYKHLISPWIGNAELIRTITTLTEKLYDVREGTMEKGVCLVYLDSILDGKYGLTLSEDSRFEGNAIHCLRLIISGKPLVLRDSFVRGVSDRSGKK